MAAATAIFNQHSDVRVEHGALIFPMPVECYDRLMDSESLPRGSSYNGPDARWRWTPCPTVDTTTREPSPSPSS